MAIALAAFWGAPSSAQVRAGVHGLYQSGAFDGSFGLGARAEAELDFITQGLTVAGTYDHLFPGCADCSAFNAGLQLLIVPPRALYLGLGADYSRLDDGEAGGATDSEWAFNLIAGIRVPILPVVVPFFELRQQIWSTGLNEQVFSLGVVVRPARARNAPRRLRSR